VLSPRLQLVVTQEASLHRPAYSSRRWGDRAGGGTGNCFAAM